MPLKISLFRTASAAGILVSFACFQPMFAQGDMDRAQQILQRFIADEKATKTAEQRAAIAKEVGGLMLRVQRLTVSGVLNSLNEGSNPISPSALQKRLRHYMDDSDVLKVESGAVNFYLVGFSVPGCVICSRSWVGAFMGESGQYSLTASLENEQPDRDISLIPIPPASDGKLRFLISSEGWGDPHHRLNVQAYSLDEGQIRPYWSRTSLLYGTLKIHDDRIVLTHTTDLNPSSKTITETYFIKGGSIAPMTTHKTPDRDP